MHAQYSYSNLRGWFGFILISVLVLAGCGGGSGGGVDATSTTQMGGARQGFTLNLVGAVSTPAGIPSMPGALDGTGTASLFNQPLGITTDGNYLYVSDTGNGVIRKIEISSGIVSTLAGKAGTNGSANGTGSAARFYAPHGIATDGTSLYVADTLNQTIRKIVISSGVVTTLAGMPGLVGSTDGAGIAASFKYPYGITTDGINLYVTDAGASTIRKIIIASGVVSTLAGTAGQGGLVDGIGSAASFSTPDGITTDGTNLYVADAFNNAIRKIVISSSVVTTLAGINLSGSADGIGKASRFNTPTGITTDGVNLYVVDTLNQTIRKIVIATGVVSTIAGVALTNGTTDGTGMAAKFYNPIGITTDGVSLYVADQMNDTIRKIK